MLKGRIHSIETMGLMDGPGIRTIFFMQGCGLKCIYCHNPDSMRFQGGTLYTVDELVSFVKRYRPYYKETGGVTFSGGEALMQGKFLAEAVKALKTEKINIALDTCGVGQPRYYDDILRHVDFLLLDIKHYDPHEYQRLTGICMEKSREFMARVADFQGRIWIRHTMVPGFTDNGESMDRLFDHIRPWAASIDKIEVLPYHKMGVGKYELMGLDDPLKDTPEMSKSRAKAFQDRLEDKLNRQKKILG
ncbi:MAG: pyruvate formate-lyase-activating protein [Desulfobacterales bacterium]|nr:pyruvate formate-lyase-activating protein [Desulfobacterales bacterium]